MTDLRIDSVGAPPSSLLPATVAAGAMVCGVAQAVTATGTANVVGQLNLFLVAAVVAVAVDLWRSGCAGCADRFDWALFGVALTLLALPPVSTTWAALSVCGVASLRHRGQASKGAGLLLLGLSFYLLKDRVWGGFVAGAVLELEAAVLQLAFEPVLDVADRIGNVLVLEDGRHLVILRDCSLLSLLAPALLGVVALRRLFCPTASRLGGTLLLMVFLTVLGNFLRLMAMAASPEGYALFHDGAGSTAFAGALTFLVGMVGLWRRR